MLLFESDDSLFDYSSRLLETVNFKASFVKKYELANLGNTSTNVPLISRKIHLEICFAFPHVSVRDTHLTQQYWHIFLFYNAVVNLEMLSPIF